jgi:hypothetical protein
MKTTLGFLTRTGASKPSAAKKFGGASKTRQERIEERRKKTKLLLRERAELFARAKLMASSARLKKLDVAKTLEDLEFIPQAIVRRDVRKLAKDLHMAVAEGVDDFDSYQGLAFKIGDMPFAVLHYQGHPKGTVTIYLPYDIRSVPVITQKVGTITKSLGILPRELVWQRKEDPDL